MFSSLVRVLVAGFGAVIVLLLAAGAIAVNSARSVRESAAALVASQLTTTKLIDELEREQDALTAVFYKLSKPPEEVDWEQVLADVTGTDERITRMVHEAAGDPEPALWTDFRRAANRFSEQARRLLAERRVPAYSLRDLLHRHQEVTTVVARLINAGYRRSVAAQREIERRSATLVRESLLLLAAGLAAALLCAVLTVRVAAKLFQRMEWQATELSRVSWRLVESQEATARRFSHELHDELGQSLTAIKANLMAIEAAGVVDPARLEDCRKLADDAIRDVRELSQLLRPTILDDFGLDASIRWLAERFAQRTGIAVDYQSDFDGRLVDETETQLFRIVQEALTNAARHSGATRVEIRLTAEADRVNLKLKDNGKGLDGPARQRGMGLVGMRARARGAGGELAIDSKPGEGVRIEVWVPRRAA